eukprot:gene5003-10010_t
MGDAKPNPCQDMEESHSFYIFAMMDIYGIHNDNKSNKFYQNLFSYLCVEYGTKPPDFISIERYLSSIQNENLISVATTGFHKIKDRLTQPEDGFSGLFSNKKNNLHLIKWSCNAIFSKDNPMTLNYTIKFNKPILETASCAYWDMYGCDQFLSVNICNIMDTNIPRSSQFWAQLALFDQGINFANKHYKFLGGESVPQNNNYADSNDRISMIAWFVAVDKKLSVRLVRNSLGSFAGQSTNKINSRLKLGFSRTFPSIRLEDNQIRMIDDIESGGNVLTDGCGFISAELAVRIPNISNGKVHSSDTSYPVAMTTVTTLDNMSSSSVPMSASALMWRRREQDGLPCIIQVRLVANRGLFKGCLLVTRDEEICPRNCVVFRPSMKKADGPCHILKSVAPAMNILRVNTTFERGDNGGSINRYSCLLLSSLNVMRSVFVKLLQDQLEDVLGAVTDRMRAYRLVKSSMRTASSSTTSPTD